MPNNLQIKYWLYLCI